MVLGHFNSNTAPASVAMKSPLASCLVQSYVAIEWGKRLEILRKEKKTSQIQGLEYDWMW